MLTPEQARAALDARAGDTKDVQNAIKRLPEADRRSAWAFLHRDADGKEFGLLPWHRRHEVRAGAAAHLDAMGPAARAAFWTAFFPNLGADLMERTWQARKATPYQTGYHRKPFRAAGDPALTGAKREEWFHGLVSKFARYDPDLEWLAAWAGHVDPMGMEVAPVLAAAIDAGGPAAATLSQTLRDSATGAHEVGVTGGHVTRAFLAAGDPEGWQFVEKLLLAAQRQEGLRQSILESVDESHPQAFRRMLRVIVEHDLARFSATVRALDVWLGFGWDSVSVKAVNSTVERLVVLLDDPPARAEAIASGEAEDAYHSLWATAFDDAPAAVGPAAELLHDPDVGRRFVAVHLLGQLGLGERTMPHLLGAIDDADLRVAVRAAREFGSYGENKAADRSDLFERAERLLARLPAKPRPLDPIVWPWQVMTADRRWVTHALLNHVGDRPVSRLVALLPAFDPYQRARVVQRAVAAAPKAPETRALLLDMTADPSVTVRQAALKGLEGGTVGPDEARRLEALLTRKADDLRRGVLTLLAAQDDDDALASADRLLAASKPDPRRAGLELLRQLAEAGRRAGDCRARAATLRDTRAGLDTDESRQVALILDTGRKVATLDDALGLIDPADRTRPTSPAAHDRPWITAAAFECLRSLSALVHEHREEPIAYKHTYLEGKMQEELLGNIQWGFPVPDPATPAAVDADRLPLRAVWEGWWKSRPGALRDKDGLELLRAWALPSFVPGEDGLEDDDPTGAWCLPKPLARAIKKAYGVRGLQSLPYVRVVAALIPWLLKLHPPAGSVGFLLDAVETSFSKVPADVLAYAPKESEAYTFGVKPDWRAGHRAGYAAWLQTARSHRSLFQPGWTPDESVRFYRLLRWMDEPGTGVPRKRPNFDELLTAYAAGGATEADLYDHLLGPSEGRHDYRHDLRRLTGRKPAPEITAYPILRTVVDRCRARVVEVELDRGEAPTAASHLALSVRSLGGLETLVPLVRALGSKSFDRGINWQADASRTAVLSHLIRATMPNEGDAPEALAPEIKALGTSTERLVEMAVFAPQWARYVEHALGWPQLEEAVWWLHAHTKGNDWTVDPEIRGVWTAEVASRTALTAADLVDGAVDVAWFHRVYKALRPKRWPTLDEAARYASGGSGHARARLSASAMLGRVKKADLVGRVTSKRNADALRALGLLPLAGGAARQRDLLDRYKRVQEFLRTSKQFGAQRQASEKRAAGIALDNLARTAGYADPIRLEWAMEATAVADLARGPVSVEVDGVTVALSLDGLGQPDLIVTRAGKALKAIPPAVKKHKAVAALAERKTDLKRQASRVRQSLEAAMCRGDTLTGDELKRLAAHAVLWPLLSRLVLIGEGIAGYPAEAGRALRNHGGRLEPVKPDEALRVAHPNDLLALGDWHLWQHECFAAERVQPFKQVFRELYVLTDTERAEGYRSLRYAGHQVNPRQALALLGGRGWVSHPEEGVRRTFHAEGLTAELDVMGLTFSPADVEGLTVESVHFSKRGEWKPVPLEQVPPRLFSEVMRDLDLVVSVAHRGAVDPEASASTVEMRGSLLRETLGLLGLANVRVNNAHALIDGTLGHYSLHLGSGVVHRQPGGALCIVPVHAQHRGRLFLPFADDDPMTAEVISKALLLARDAEIQDPTILAQIRAAP